MKGKFKSLLAGLSVFIITLILILTFYTQAQTITPPGESGPCPVTAQSAVVNGIDVDIYYPDGACGTYTTAPYAAITFAHGFSMFGLSDGAAENQGNGQHLASWGYIVAVPSLPDDTEERTGIFLDVVDFLEVRAGNPSSSLYQKIDVNRLAAAGYSLGGATALSAAARDGRIQVVVALDPVYHAGGFSGEGDIVWNAAAEAPLITVPIGILGAPASSCNAEADYGDIYPLIGAEHKAYYHLVGASHCDFVDPGSIFCSLTCGTGDIAKTQLSQKYMTAWFNYYLQQKTEFYTYLYGEQLAADVTAGKVEHGAATAPRGLTAVALPEAVALQWKLTNYPVIVGYHLYRRLPGGAFPGTPQAAIGLQESWVDGGLTAGQPYEYAIRSRDLAGNLHQFSTIVTVIPLESAAKLFLPLVCRQ